MTDDAIRVEHVFKKFRRGERHGSLRDAMASWFRLGSGCESTDSLQQAEFWAVEDLSFNVARGEALGIIGPNGAGKSTMLKLLAGIMRPNRGRVFVDGRVSALIEVGAGFHPDLTGRENIYLNASILGMTRTEVRGKFDDIVEFAGIRDFLETPIKRYSSGMYARLGFAVAAHVDPQVLLVDEVLSVGDRVFRSRCMDRMRSFLKQGVAVVFVSHDLGSVSTFCDKAIVMAAGKTLCADQAPVAVAQYHKACQDKWMLPETRDRELVTVADMRLLNASGESTATFRSGDTLRVEFDVHFDMEMERPSFGLTLMRAKDHLFVFETSSTRMHHESPPARPGTSRRVAYTVCLHVPPGEYSIGYHVRDRDASMYAAMRDAEVRLMVSGEAVSGGMVDLEPRIEEQELKPTQEALVASV